MNRENKYIIDELEIFNVCNKKTTSVIANKNGVLDTDSVNKSKKKFLKQSINYLTDELITIKKGYPTKDKAIVELEVDFVVLDRNSFNKLKEWAGC